MFVAFEKHVQSEATTVCRGTSCRGSAGVLCQV